MICLMSSIILKVGSHYLWPFWVEGNARKKSPDIYPYTDF